MGYVNGPNNQEKRGQVIEFFSILTGDVVNFKAFLTDFEDSFSSEWNSEDVYGRMDPIQTFKGTTRTISMSWDCVADGAEEAQENMAKCSKLFKMLYPSYEGTTMKGSPLIKLKFVNLVHDASVGAPGASAKEGGLTGTIDGFAYSPDLDQGFFEGDKGASVYPQTIALTCTFTVMHTHDLGYKTGGGTLFPEEYPYHIKKEGNVVGGIVDAVTNAGNTTPSDTGSPGDAAYRSLMGVLGLPVSGGN